MKNICRVMTIYSDFLPPANNSRPEWTWRTFGYYDGVSVSDNLYQDNSSFEVLCEYGMVPLQRLDGRHFFSNLWLFRSEAERSQENEEGYDGLFWKRAQEMYPFLFITLIQVDPQDGYLDGWNSRMQLELHINKHLEQFGGGAAITYMTLDTSDMVLVITCKNYNVGAGVANDLHSLHEPLLKEIFGWNLRYSFTLASVHQSILKDQERMGQIQSRLEEVQIYVIERFPGSINYIYSRVLNHFEMTPESCDASKIRRQTLLGCNDEMITLHNVEWSKFLGLYAAEGVLNPVCDIYRSCVIGVTTIIGHVGGKTQIERISKKNPLEIREVIEKERMHEERTRLCNVILERCKTVINMGNHQNSVTSSRLLVEEFVWKNVLHIVNALGKFEIHHLRDYVFQTAIRQIYMLVEMYGEYVKGMREDDAVDDYIQDAYDYIKEFDLYLQNSVRSDRQFTQSPNFSVRVYETPIKLIAFYNAFIYQTNQFLNSLQNRKKGVEERHSYEFLAYPGFTDSVRVREHFRGLSLTKRLFTMELPEMETYKPKELLIVLAHEIAHYVGTDTRSRKERARFALNALTPALTNLIYYSIGKNCESEDEFRAIQDDATWQELRRQLRREIDAIWETEVKERSRICGRSDEAYTSGETEELMNFVFAKVWNAYIREEDDLWKNMLVRDRVYWLNKLGERYEKADERQELLRDGIHRIVNGYIEVDETRKDGYAINSFYKLLFHLYHECFADLICIMTLRLSMREYITTAIGVLRDINERHVAENGLLYRLSLVCYCMVMGEGCEWKEEMQILEKGDDMIRIYARRIHYIWTEWLMNSRTMVYKRANDSMWKRKTEKNQIAYAFFDQDVMLCIIKYLNECKKKFVMNVGTNGKKNQEKLRGMLRLFDVKENGQIEMLLKSMQENIDTYYEEIRKNNNELIN